MDISGSRNLSKEKCPNFQNLGKILPRVIDKMSQTFKGKMSQKIKGKISFMLNVKKGKMDRKFKQKMERKSKNFFWNIQRKNSTKDQRKKIPKSVEKCRHVNGKNEPKNSKEKLSNFQRKTAQKVY